MSAGSTLLHAYHLLRDGGVERNMTVADFGCGSHGHLVVPASRVVGEDGHVYAVDLVPAHLHMLRGTCAHHGCTNVDYVWGNYEIPRGIAIPDHSVDVVFFVNNLWQTGDFAAALQEVKRVLQPSGSLVIVDWQKKIAHPVAPPAERRMDVYEARRHLAQAGVRRLKWLALPETHWGYQCSFLDAPARGR
ncbi:MAG: methyltransferase domain-containing protein [Patescibacteria group bacterium]|jgi:ubiquinone/menaquinone biosynthesis C-methylase UbiE